MYIPTFPPGRNRSSKMMFRWVLPVSLFILIVMQTGCKNRSGITEATDSPFITLTNPENNASGVAVNSSIVVVFGEEMDPATITNNSFIIRLDTVTVNGTITYTDSTAVFSPSGNLEFGSTYTAVITTDVQNLSGNTMDSDYEWTFTTTDEPSEDDTTPPQIASTSPVDDAEGVSINTSVSATFSEPINASTINANTFSLTNGSTPISGNISNSGNTVTMSLSNTLEFATTYTATIDQSVEDTAGNSLGADYSWSFTTGTQPDNTAPVVNSTNPPDDEDDVAVSTTITAVFNEPINTSTIDNSTFFVERNNSKISGTYSFSGNSVTFTPSNTLSFEARYDVTITTGVEDMAGNAMEENFEWNFETSDEPDDDDPEVDSREPGNNQQNVDITTNIAVTFNEAINPSTVNSSTFFLRAGGTSIQGTYNISGNTVTLNPSNNLSYATIYTATLTTGIEDLAGNGLSNTVVWDFTTTNEPDVTAPQVASRNPQPNASNVDIGTNVTAEFNEAINGSTVNGSTFILEQGNNQITASYNLSGNTAILNPSQDLSYSTTYSVTLTTGIEDLAGNGLSNTVVWDFTTEEAPDNTAPSINSTTPADNAQGVLISTNITATFDEAINRETVNDNTFFLSNNGTRISGTISFDGNSIIFNPNGSLSYQTTYTATVTTGVEDQAGNALQSNVVWDFTTENAPDDTEPEIDFTSPNDGAENVSVNVDITATFNEAMNSNTINGNSFRVRGGGQEIDGTITLSGNTARFDPAGALEFGTDYTAIITDDVEDLAGNKLDNNFEWNFTTEQESVAPSVIDNNPDNGATNVPIGETISVTFDESMDPSTLSNSFILTQNGNDVNGSVSLLSGNTFQFISNQDLQYNTTYTATVTTDATDLVGNNLENDFSWSFTTEQETEPPRIIDTNPKEGAIDVPLDVTISVTFNEAINAETVTTSSFVVSFSGNPIPGRVDSWGNPAFFTFTPSNDLESDGTYTVTITTDVQDLAGNAMTENYIWNFTTDSLSNGNSDDDENDD